MNFHADDKFQSLQHIDLFLHFVVAPGQTKGENKREFYHRIKRALLIGSPHFDRELVTLGLLLQESLGSLTKQRLNNEVNRLRKTWRAR